MRAMISSPIAIACSRLVRLQQHGELVAAEPADRVVDARAVADPRGHRDEHRVAAGVAERVVDVLEAVEVDQHERPRRARAP